MRKLKNYKPTKFKAKDSYYDKEYADLAVCGDPKKLDLKAFTHIIHEDRTIAVAKFIRDTAHFQWLTT